MIFFFINLMSFTLFEDEKEEKKVVSIGTLWERTPLGFVEREGGSIFSLFL